MSENESLRDTRSSDEVAYNEFMRDHSDQLLLENSSDSIDDMVHTLVDAGFVSKTGDVIK